MVVCIGLEKGRREPQLRRIAKGVIKRNKFYYGWVIAALASLGFFFSSPGQTYFISGFIDSYIHDFGWNRVTVSSIYSLATLSAGMLLYIVGRFSDKYGQKKTLIVIAFLLGAACIWNSFVSSLWMLFLGFFLIRLTGQGSMTLVPSAIIPQWFLRRRALAFSIMALGKVIGSAVVPPVNTWFINLWGWNRVWWIWAILLALFFIPIVILFVYDRPEDLDLQIDNGEDKKTEYTDRGAQDTDRSYTVKEAIRIRSFWGMLFCQMLLPLIVTGMVFHFVSILEVKGMSETTAAFIMSLFAIVSFPATLLAGYMMDRVKMQHAAAFTCILQLVGLGILLFSTTTLGIIMFAIMQGTAMGFQSVCGGIVWPNYFGTKHLGSIRGIAMTAVVIASAVGPIPFGIVYDAKGNYTIAILIMMVLSCIGIIAAFLSPKPEELARKNVAHT